MKRKIIVPILLLITSYFYANAQVCQWAERIGGASGNENSGNRICSDSFGNTYISGRFIASLLELNNGISLHNRGGNDAYIAKYNSDGVCQWGYNIGGTGEDYAKNITVDDLGNVFLVGYFDSENLELNNNISLQVTKNSDAFVAKFNSDGVCQWAQKVSGNNNVFAYDVTSDSQGNIFIIGTFGNPSISFNNQITLTNPGKSDAYIAKYNSNGICQWAKNIGGIGPVEGICIAYNKKYDLINIAGSFDSTTINFPNGQTLRNSGSTDSYLASYTTDGVCQWAEKIAGNGHDQILSICNDNDGNIYAGGTFSGGENSWDIIFNMDISLHLSDGVDGFLAKYTHNGYCQWALSLKGNKNEVVEGVTLDGYGNVLITGAFNSKITTFGNNITLENNGNFDSYIATYNSDNGNCKNAIKISGTNYDLGSGVSTDQNGSIYITGNYLSANLIFNNNKSINNSGNSDGYIAKYNNFTELKETHLHNPSCGEVDVSCTPTFQWESINGANSYRLIYSKDSLFKFYINEVVLGNSFIPINELQYGTKWYWKVQPINEISIGNWSNIYSFTTEYGNEGEIEYKCDWSVKGNIWNSYNYDKDGNIYEYGELRWDTVELGNNITLIPDDSLAYIYVAKYNNNGVCQWANKVAHCKDGFSNRGLEVDVFGNIYLLVDSYDSLINFGNTIIKEKDGNKWILHCIAKFSPEGSFLWAKSLNNIPSREVLKIDKLQNVYYGGIFEDKYLEIGDTIVLQKTDTLINTFIAKLDVNGNFLWANKIAADDDLYGIDDIVIDSLNNVLVVGNTTSCDTLKFNNQNILINNGMYNEDIIYLAQYNSDGEYQYAKKICSASGTEFLDIQLKSDYLNSLFITARSYYYASANPYGKIVFDNNITLNQTSDYNNSFVAKLGKDGLCQWARTISNNVNNVGIGSLNIDKSNNIIISGHGWGYEYANFKNATFSFNNGVALTCDEADIKSSKPMQGYIAKFSNSGDCQWVMDLRHKEIRSVFLDREENIYCISEHLIRDQNSQASYFPYDSISKYSKIESNAIIIYNTDELPSELLLSPNPSNEYCEIVLKSGNNSINSIQIFNLNGEIVAEYLHPEFVDSKLKINVNELPNGIYSVVAISGNKSYSSKMIITR